MSMLAWFLWPTSAWRVEPEPLFAFLGAFLLWAYSNSNDDIAGGPQDEGTFSGHDKKLLGEFRACFSEEEKRFLREHDFGGAFNWKKLEGLQNFAADWQGAEYEFDDPDVQIKFAEILQKSRQFLHDLSLGTWMIDRSQQWASAITEADRQGVDWRPSTRKRVDGFNELSTDLIDSMDGFIKFARQRLGN
ncbi:hypothetical protein [Phenylobacterium sp.]|uniref:hypothetical protein n=1 Tax=Phenylobacterium sp. TaxID=1871053 RepID=UPI002FC7A4C4